MIETFNEYQKATSETAIYPKDKAIEYLLLGLCSEAGECAGKYKKILRDNDGVVTPEKRAELIFELGDVKWHISELANTLGTTLEEIATNNIFKLKQRKANNTISGSGDNR